jgi:hypothetical protein
MTALRDPRSNDHRNAMMIAEFDCKRYRIPIAFFL